MNEMAQYINHKATYSTCITRYPTGRFGLVGSVPVELTQPARHGTPQHPPVRESMAWKSEQEVVDALLSIGVTRFQLANCAWYEGS